MIHEILLMVMIYCAVMGIINGSGNKYGRRN